MIRLCLLLLPGLAAAQQWEVPIRWQGTESVQVQSEILPLPSPVGHTVFFDENSEQFLIEIGQKLTASESDKKFLVTKIEHEVIPTNGSQNLYVDKLPSSPSASCIKTNGRGDQQLLLSFTPFYVVDSKIFRITSLQISAVTPPVVTQSQVLPTLETVSDLPEKAHRFEVEKTGIHKLTGRFLKRIGVPIKNINPSTIKIYGRGGSMLPLVNAETTDVGMRENPLMLVGMEDGSIENDDYILFYAYGPKNWSAESRTFNNLYHNAAHYLLSYGGTQGKRVQTITTTESISDPITSAEVTIHHEEDVTNIANMGRRWYGASFYGSSDRDYSFDLTNRAEATSAKLTVAGAGVSDNTTQLKINVADVLETISFAPKQKLTRATLGSKTMLVTPNGDDLKLTLAYESNDDNGAIAYLDYIQVVYERELSAASGQFGFRLQHDATHFASLADAVWEQTADGNINVYMPSEQGVFFTPENNENDFQLYTSSDAYVPVRSRLGDAYESPNTRASLENEVEYIIITSAAFAEEAERLADHHRTFSGLQTLVLTLDEIYDDFSAANPDIAALRNAIRYAYKAHPSKLKYVCLFGDTSYDYKDITPNNNNIVPTFHALGSFHVANTFMSDDFYAMMDEGEGSLASGDVMDLAVGRMLFDTPLGARTAVNKAIEYSLSHGDWQNSFTLLSDDPDKDWEVSIQQELDRLGDELSINKPFVNVTKIHSDAYQQVVTAAGDRYPDVSQALENQINQGTLVVNYFGHGGEEGLANEFIYDKNMAQRLYHPGRYPLFVTSTCEFSRFDNPNLITAGEMTYANPSGGAISLISTTRQIFVSNGISYNNILSKHLFAYGSDEYPSMAEALRLAKREFSGTAQKRIVFYIGDPALRLSIPGSSVALTKFNDTELDALTDAQKQLRALDKVRLSGEVIDASGDVSSNFNGEVVVTVFDKSVEKSTLNNSGYGVMDFKTLGNIIFRGNTTVNNGIFDIDFVVPKDISLPVGAARISLYAHDPNSLRSVTGYSEDINVGGLNPNPVIDLTGPDISLFLNDKGFNSGDQTGPSPTLLVDLFDENGINTSGGLGHELLAVLDGLTQTPIILNNYYKEDYYLFFYHV
ncbi:MAG: type IX secretion system sortase PorU [Flavobacteriaceae bacterium]